MHIELKVTERDMISQWHLRHFNAHTFRLSASFDGCHVVTNEFRVLDLIPLSASLSKQTILLCTVTKPGRVRLKIV